MRAAEEDVAASPFARLPDALVALVLSHLSDVASIGRALTVSRGFAAAGTADARLVWARAAAALQWRLRRRESETDRELCVRANARRQRIAVFGGSFRSPLYTHDMYDVARQEWLPSPFLFTTYPRDASALASDGATVALLGGWGGTRAVRAVEAASLTEEARSWKRLTPLPRRLCFGAAQMDASGRLWFAGGGVLHLDGGAWREAGELVSPRCGLAVAADARSSSFFALGGYAGGTRYLSTAEAFDTATGKSTPIPSMGVARSGPGAAVGPDGALYVVGGSSFRAL
ncbi:hypothetical protein EMIHUDRAFT_206488 [Emiliania huxleyi CCMP1516]|uniref:F-box domain-containing protein n=2 Tax=Emiliania huxleyi TaxID=2903 RepID=A0A0D3JLY6_EMIH1|nr:hypothetical protein EMIHUDRAFT_206488 [Emiliania huxleyi CCMP1516]EOD24521.1 hypothetical protein EMIHUDRAFT_206488 [Emiliania huxleyi CCMP1516]|eukprot:XP_005776950.1 hypothetical protein EMIHUDRAFT_206488 [Emiliania huxleyi CCMP1516]